jgi:hypothetical protein
MQTRSDGGSMLTEATAVAVVPWRSDPLWAETMLTVLAKRRMALRKAAFTISSSISTGRYLGEVG